VCREKLQLGKGVHPSTLPVTPTPRRRPVWAPPAPAGLPLASEARIETSTKPTRLAVLVEGAETRGEHEREETLLASRLTYWS
jgi:hypothetical protein